MGIIALTAFSYDKHRTEHSF